MDNTTLQNIISLARQKGFIFPSSEIYGGLANSWDYGPLGVEVKNNIKQAWWNTFVHSRQDVVGLDSALLMNSKVWDASGHTQAFTDPLVEDSKTHERYRLDHILEDNDIDAQDMDFDDMKKALKTHNIKSPKGNALTEPKHFNLMFETAIGSTQEKKDVVYLRPETAQAMFVDFKHIASSSRLNLPFGIAQIGKAFRNEITPGNYIFRTREFEQMEIEYFVRQTSWKQHFDEWVDNIHQWIKCLGINKEKVHMRDIPDGERAHYSERTIDFEYDFPFGRKELYGLAYRGDYDLQQHTKHSGEKLMFTDPHTGEKIVPHTIEPSFGVERTLLVVLLEAYYEDESMGETRVVLQFPAHLAPYKVAVLPLVSNDKKLVVTAQKIFQSILGTYPALYDESGTIGRRYRRNDEIGTPLCLTVDFDTLKDNSVTVRDRDSMEQVRIGIDDIPATLMSRIQGNHVV